MSAIVKSIQQYQQAILKEISQFTLLELKALWLKVLDTNSKREHKTYDLLGMETYDDIEADV